ncbi:membrane protein [Helicobacter pylori UM085]|nr:membrane protein [Helicobacter pylori UM085]
MERFLQKKKKKQDFMGGLALNFWGILKTLFGIFGFFNVKSHQRK